VERPGLNSAAIVAGLAVNAGLMVLLFPRLGLTGAALSVTIGYVVESAVAMVSFTRLSGERMGRLFWIDRADVGEIRGMMARFRRKKSEPGPT
jgi:O-antigen/teichoic acid export membrane protein